MTLWNGYNHEAKTTMDRRKLLAGWRGRHDRGLIATLDTMLAYSISFVFIGVLALLLSSPQQAASKEIYSLNTISEDVADAIGESFGWNADVDPSGFEDDLRASIDAIAKRRYVRIDVSGVWDYTSNPYNMDPQTIAVSMRFFYTDAHNTLKKLYVKVGR